MFCLYAGTYVPLHESRQHSRISRRHWDLFAMLHPLWRIYILYVQSPTFSFPYITTISIMRAPSSLEVFSFLNSFLIIGAAGLTLPPNQEIDAPDSLTILSVNASDIPIPICTSSFIWTGSAGPPYKFKDDCYQAWQSFLTTDYSAYKNRKFEFSQLGLTDAWPGVPKMATPRRYIKSAPPSCHQEKVMLLTNR